VVVTWRGTMGSGTGGGEVVPWPRLDHGLASYSPWPSSHAHSWRGGEQGGGTPAPVSLEARVSVARARCG
jgi:hypothetical protein